MSLLVGLKNNKKEPSFRSDGSGDQLLKAMKPSFRPKTNLTLVIPVAEQETVEENSEIFEIGECFKKIDLNRLKVI